MDKDFPKRRRFRGLRILLWIVIIILLLPVFLVLLIQLPPVQQFAKTKVEGFLRNKFHTTVLIGQLRLNWWNSLSLKRVYLGDMDDKALLYSGSLKVNFNLLSLINNKLVISKVDWDDLLVNVYRLPGDSTYNYQFIIDAFASKEEKTDTSSADPMTFSFGDLSITNCRIRYIDAPSGMATNVKWKSLYINPDEIKPENALYAVKSIELEGLRGIVQQQYITTPDLINDMGEELKEADTETSAASPFLVKAGLLQLKDCNLWYGDESSGINTHLLIGNFGISNTLFDQARSTIEVDNIKLHRTAGALAMQQAKDTVTTVIATDTTAKTAWIFKVKNVDVDKLDFKYSKLDAPSNPDKKALDLNNMDFTGIRLQAKDIGYYTDSILVDLNEFSLRDKSGFAVKEFRGDLLYSDKIIALRDLMLQTNKSRLSSEVVVQVPSWATISDNLNEMKVRAILENTYIDMTEIGQILPDLKNNPSLRPILRKIIRAEGNITGSMEQLQVNALNVSDNDGTRVRITAQIRNAANADKMVAVVQQVDIISGERSIKSWLPAGTIPDSISIPSSLRLMGNVTYSKTNLAGNLRMNTSLGDLAINGQASNYTDAVNSRYDVSIPVLKMNIGELLQDTTLGLIDLSLSAKGRGYDYKTLTANLDLLVRQAYYKKYGYSNINAAASLDRGEFNLFLDSKDPNALATLELKGLIDSLKGNIAGYVNLEKIDMFATNLSSSPMAAKGNVVLDIPGIQPRHLNGEVILSQIQFADDSTIYALDTLRLLASDSNNRQQVTIGGPFGYVAATGDYDYTKAFAEMAAMVSQHLQPATDSNRTNEVVSKERQVMDIDGSLIWPASLNHLVPGLEMNRPLKLNGHFNTDSSLLNLAFQLPGLGFNEFILDSLTGQINSNLDSLAARIYLASLTHPQFPLQQTTIDLAASNGLLNGDLRLQDKTENLKYAIGALVKFLPKNGLSISLKPGLVLNKTTWNVSDSNEIVIGDGALRAADLGISSNGQSLMIKTVEEHNEATPDLEINLDQFRLSTITAMLEQDSLLAEGLASGKATIRNMDVSPLIEAAIDIDSIVVKNTSLGTLNVKANTPQPGAYNLEAKLSGNGNDININGSYGEQMNINVALNNLSLASIEPLMMGAAQRMSGAIKGDLALTGTSSDPQIKGALRFDSVAANVTAVGAYLKMPSNELTFNEQGIGLNNFVILDSLNNKAVINGNIITRDYKDYRFQLDVNADDFMAIGPKQNADQMIYGPAFVDATAKVRGTLDLPRIDLRLALKDSSQFSLVLPESEPGITEREGVIVFVDRDSQLDSSLLRLKDTVALNTPEGLKGMALTARIDITPSSTLRVIIDQQNGDFLEVKGTANLDATMNPGSDLSLTGRFEIDEGQYNMSLNNLIKRTFNIEKGSTITFQGEATDALVDITARYRVEAQAGDLVEDQLAGASDSRRTQFRQKVPVDVYLQVRNELLKPEISFRLDMPERERNVLNGVIYNRIKQINEVESELNKQVMGLLVLNSFIPENPLDLANNRGGSGVAGTARKSASKLISQQLNNFAGDLIKGFDINFDLASQDDYSTGEMQNSTNLNIGVSKSLFNDRVSVTVGSSVNLEGPQQAQQASTLVGDVSVDYKITPDGKYRLRAYRQNETDAIVEGQIIETGASFIYVIDYNEFRELFQSKKKTATNK